jgi:hypothetical protein
MSILDRFLDWFAAFADKSDLSEDQAIILIFSVAFAGFGLGLIIYRCF